MTNFSSIALTPESTIDKTLVTLCKSVKAKRARTVIDHILLHGIITNEELSELYGYDHPPRAIRDVRDNGIPLITHSVISPKTGRRMGAYTFDSLAKIRAGRVGGRKAFSKSFKAELVGVYGAKDAITGERLDERYLQIDHRVPYEVGGDSGNQMDPKDFMLLDASSNRAKSWSCEHCNNFLVDKNSDICRTCFWASPEDYQHIAGIASRRAEIVWRGEEVSQYDKLFRQAASSGMEFPVYLKNKLSE